MLRRDFFAAASLIAGASLAPKITMARARRVFDVKQFGAAGDGITPDTHAVQAAIDAANHAGGGVVHLPPGIYLSGSLILKSHVELNLDANAQLLGSASFSDYRRIDNWYGLLLANGQEHIAVSGAGTVNGQGRLLAQDVIRRAKLGEIDDPLTGYGGRPEARHRPVVIAFRQCRNVRVSGVTLRDSSCWVENYIECDNLVIENIRVESTAYWNNDGIDISDCTNVRISGCDINSDDDGICLKSFNPAKGCENVEISNCLVRSSASALKFGSSCYGGFRNVHAHDLNVYNTYRSAVALECVDGGVLKNVLVENINAPNTGNAVFVRLGHRNAKVPPGQLSDIIIRNLKVQVPAGAPDFGYETAGPPVREPHNIFPASITGLPGHPVSGVVLENIEVTYAGGGTRERADVPWDKPAQVPEVATEYPEFSMFGELPAWGFYTRHARDIKFSNCRFTLQKADYRPAMVFDDVEGLHLDGVNLGPLSGEPVIVLDNVKGAVLQDMQYPEGIPKRDQVRRLEILNRQT